MKIALTNAAQLFNPFPEEHYSLLWAWLNENPDQNFDDGGPRSLVEFSDEMRYRKRHGQVMWEVIQSGQPVGAIAYSPARQIFRGICFAKAVHGTGVAEWAVREVLRGIFESGTKVVWAEFFSDNLQVRRFLQKLGAVDKQRIMSKTTRGGLFIDWSVLEIKSHDFFRTDDRQGSDSGHRVPPEGVSTSS